jgi:hypothetical protein
MELQPFEPPTTSPHRHSPASVFLVEPCLSGCPHATRKAQLDRGTVIACTESPSTTALVHGKFSSLPFPHSAHTSFSETSFFYGEPRFCSGIVLSYRNAVIIISVTSSKASFFYGVSRFCSGVVLSYSRNAVIIIIIIISVTSSKTSLVHGNSHCPCSRSDYSKA